MSKFIILQGGKTTLVENDDFDFLSEYKWHLHTGGYAIAYKDGLYIYMHRLILNPPKEKLVDHINKNKLDNRKSNLRIVNKNQNMFNSSGQKRRKSKYKGVHYAKANKKWCAQISWNKNRKNLGYFETEEQAAEEYNKAAMELHGNYAQLNIIGR